MQKNNFYSLYTQTPQYTLPYASGFGDERIADLVDH